MSVLVAALKKINNKQKALHIYFIIITLFSLNLFYVIFIKTLKFIEGIVLSSFVAGCDRQGEEM